MKEVISTPQAPEAIGAYSQAIKVNNMLFCSGQIALDPRTMKLVNATVAEEAEQVFTNLAQVLKAANTDFGAVVKVMIYLTDMADFQAVNTVMMNYFELPYPARACVAVSALPKGAKVEVDFVAVLHDL